MNGLFITFEGADACGKTTQSKLLAKYFAERYIDSVLTREPGGTVIAERIRELLLDKDNTISPRGELLLYLAARSEHVAFTIKPALQAGKMVLCDRFVDSTLVYQGIARRLGLDEVIALHNFASDNLWPDITFLFTASQSILTERLATRSSQDRLESQDNDFKQSLAKGFVALSHKYPKRIVTINAQLSIEEIHKIIIDYLQTNFTIPGGQTNVEN